jgi:hypothetical protein
LLIYARRYDEAARRLGGRLLNFPDGYSSEDCANHVARRRSGLGEEEGKEQIGGDGDGDGDGDGGAAVADSRCSVRGDG